MSDLNARIYAVGSDAAESVELRPGMASALNDKQLLWIDGDDGVDTLAAVDAALQLKSVATGLSEVEGQGLRFLDGAIRLSVFGLGEHHQPGRPVPVLVHILAAPNAVVSIHDGRVRGLEEPVAAVEGDPRFGDLNAGTFVGLLLDGILNGYFQELEAIEREVDEVDERALRREATDDLVDALVGIRHRIAIIRRSLAPQREVYAALARPLGEQDSSIGAPWPELTERLERTIDAAEHARELLLGSFDIVMTRTGQRTNDIMRVLTVVSVVLLPSVVIAGVMGMNFHPGFFDDPGLFFVVVVVMVGLALLTLAVARRRRWL